MILYSYQRDTVISGFFWIWIWMFIIEGMLKGNWNVGMLGGVMATALIWGDRYYYEQVEQ